MRKPLLLVSLMVLGAVLICLGAITLDQTVYEYPLRIVGIALIVVTPTFF